MNLADDVDLGEFAKQAEGMSGAETSFICREAGLKALSSGNTIETLDIDKMEDFKI